MEGGGGDGSDRRKKLKTDEEMNAGKRQTHTCVQTQGVGQYDTNIRFGGLIYEMAAIPMRPNKMYLQRALLPRLRMATFREMRVGAAAQQTKEGGAKELKFSWMTEETKSSVEGDSDEREEIKQKENGERQKRGRRGHVFADGEESDTGKRTVGYGKGDLDFRVAARRSGAYSST